MNTRTNRNALVLILGAGLLSACGSEVAKVNPGPQCDFRAVNAQGPYRGPALVPLVPGSAEVMPLNSVNLMDKSITNKILVQQTTARREEDGEVSVQTRLINCTDFPLQLEARTHFLDQTGMDAESVTAWTRLYSEPHGLTSYATRSTAGSVVNSYLVEVRESQ